MTVTVSTYKITVSVKGDISTECVTDVTKFLQKRCKRLFIVVENNTDKQHLHACILLAKPPKFEHQKQWKSDFFRKTVQPHHPDSIGKHAVVLTTMYNHDWYNEYLKKDDNRNVILDDYDTDEFGTAFPSPDEQEALQTAKTKPTFDPTHVKLDKLFRNRYPNVKDISRSVVLKFVYECSLDGEISFPRDDKSRFSLVENTYRYLTGYTGLNNADKKWLEKMNDGTKSRPLWEEPPSED